MSNFWTIVKKEFRRFFTDYRLVASLVLPGILIYVFYSIMGSIMPSITNNKINDGNEFKVAYVNRSSTFSTILDTALSQKYNVTNYDIEYSNLEDAKGKVKNKTYDILFNFEENFDAKVEAIKNNTSTTQPTVITYYLSTSDTSAFVYTLSDKILVNFNVKTYQSTTTDVADQNGTVLKIISSVLPMIVISLLFSTCLSICPESIAGEKERGTIATLLITPIKRSELAGGKIFALSVISSIGALFSFVGVVLSLPKIMNVSTTSVFFLSPLQYLFMFLILFVTVIMIVSFMCVLSTYARTIKEANSIIGTTMPIVLIFSLISSFVPNNSIWISFIPIYNVSTALTQLINSQYDALFISLTIASTALYSVLFIFIVIKMFNNEKIMFNK